MDYIFGTNDFTGEETLKTKGKENTSLNGFVEIVNEYDDCVITDSFHVVKKIKSDIDSENNYYDWYIIDRHNRIIDKTKPVKETVKSMLALMLEG